MRLPAPNDSALTCHLLTGPKNCRPERGGPGQPSRGLIELDDLTHQEVLRRSEIEQAFLTCLRHFRPVGLVLHHEGLNLVERGEVLAFGEEDQCAGWAAQILPTNGPLYPRPLLDVLYNFTRERQRSDWITFNSD